jgi:hypothetical protein
MQLWRCRGVAVLRSIVTSIESPLAGTELAMLGIKEMISEFDLSWQHGEQRTLEYR